MVSPFGLTLPVIGKLSFSCCTFSVTVHIHPEIIRCVLGVFLRVYLPFCHKSKSLCYLYSEENLLNMCSVYFVHSPMFSALTRAYSCLTQQFSHFPMILFPFAVHSQRLLFLSFQVNGSDGMYKYEEIILERVSFKSLCLTVLSTFNMLLFDVSSGQRMTSPH